MTYSLPLKSWNEAIDAALAEIDRLRVNGACDLKDPRFAGLRGVDHADAMYDAYQAVTRLKRVVPVRVRRSRAKGWRMPANTIYVGRGTVFGNPFKVGQQYMAAVHPHEVRAVRQGCMTRFYVDDRPGIPLAKFQQPLTIGDVLSLFRGHAIEQIGTRRIRDELRGKNLACWCALDQPCHADVLLDIANAPVCEGVPA